MPTKHSIIVVTREAELREARLLATGIKDAGRTCCVMVSRTHFASAFSSGTTVIDIVGRNVSVRPTVIDLGNKESSHGRLADFKVWAKSAVPIIGFLKGVRLWISLYRQRKIVLTTLRKLKPCAIFLFDERTPDINMPILAEAVVLGIRTILVPYAMAAVQAREYVRLREPDCHISGIRLHFISKYLPKHLHEASDGSKLIFYPFWETLAVAWHGYRKCSPWVFGAGLSNILSVFGEYDRRAAEQEGVPYQKIRVTSQPSMDEVFAIFSNRDTNRRSIAAKYGLNPLAPIIVCAVPHQAEENLLDQSTHSSQTKSLFDVLHNQGFRHGAGVLLSLHPKSRIENYKQLAEAAGLVIVTEPLSQILPSADVMVGTLSSTIRWAAAMGIPAFVIDTLNRGYTIFKHLHSVQIVFTANALDQLMTKYFEDANVRKSLQATARDSASLVTPLDGKACERLMNLAIAEEM